jgi:BirA family biotin operon repressor/biotin-[acetyl-CoA-carboxylase] ligase
VRDRLSVIGIGAGLNTALFGRNVVHSPEIQSTNDEARRLAEGGAPEGTLVITDYQTVGRGRLDRRWEAPPGSSLLMSLLFRPALAPWETQRLTMICSLGVADAVESETGLCVGLKWPNDIVVGGAKVGGILTEIGISRGQVDYAVVGVGLNVNLDPSQLPGHLLMPATSLSSVLGKPVARLPLLWAFLRAVESRYRALRAGRSPHSQWAERLVTLGERVAVGLAGSLVEGVAEGVDPDGALLVRLASGRLETVVAGDVTLGCRGQDGPVRA